MSLLPQRKKSPEEIAKLREDLGIRAAHPEEDLSPPSAPPAAPHAVQVIDPPPLHADAPPADTQLTTPAHRPPKPIHSLRRPERETASAHDDFLPIRDDPAPAEHTSDAPVVLTLKPVRSLKKSEQVPLPVPHAPPSPDTNLPFHRHSDQELQEIRRRAALTLLTPVANPKLVVAHTSLLIFGYFTALAGALPYAVMLYQAYFPEDLGASGTATPSLFDFAPLPITIPACCVATSLLVAGFITLKKPISRHHAAFIAVITLFVIVFDILHYFPQLRHGT